MTHDERDSPRGRANSVRLALSGQLGAKALGSPAMIETMQLCVSCKSCKTACPSGIDIPKMKAETLAAARAGGWTSKALDLYARLPEYTDRARRWRALLAIRDLLPGLPRLTERWFGIAADRPWPRWAGKRFRAPRTVAPGKYRHGRAVRRYVQSLVRAREFARGGGRLECGRVRRYRLRR